MNWTDFLRFARGPLMGAALVVFAAGISYRLVRVVALGWSRGRAPARAADKTVGVLRTYLRGLGIFPFIPWVKQTFRGNAVTFLAGGLFHFGLLVIVFLGTAHMLVWKSLLGFGWPTVALPIIDGLAAATIVAMVALLINRLTHPVLRRLSGTSEFANLIVVFLPMLTGWIMAHHLWFRYEVIFGLHVASVALLLVWIPFSRLSHFVFYFFSRTSHGIEFGKRGVTP